MFTFILASTTNYGVNAATSLLDSGQFSCSGVITPAAKPVGRKQLMTDSAAAVWARAQQLPIFTVTDKITRALADDLPAVDYLLVVDFGYYIPQWLIDWPRLAAINIHPSALPKYRGASPGQAIILHQDKQSAVTIMLLAPTMDAGDMLRQIPFAVASNWSAPDYYHAAFQLANEQLPTVLSDFAAGKITPMPQVGPATLAPKLTKAAGFIPFAQLHTTDQTQLDEIWAKYRAFTPWPGLWTIVNTKQGEKRLKIVSCQRQAQQLQLNQVQLEGEISKNWHDLQEKIISL